MQTKEFYDLAEDTYEWVERNVSPEVFEWFGGVGAYMDALDNDVISTVLDTHPAFIPYLTLDLVETVSGEEETRELPDDLVAYIREHFENEEEPVGE